MDKVDQAIASAPAIRMVGIQGTLDRTGRPFILQVPADLTHEEACALGVAVLGLPERLGKKGPKLAVPKLVLPS